MSEVIFTINIILFLVLQSREDKNKDENALLSKGQFTLLMQHFQEHCTSTWLQVKGTVQQCLHWWLKGLHLYTTYSYLNGNVTWSFPSIGDSLHCVLKSWLAYIHTVHTTPTQTTLKMGPNLNATTEICSFLQFHWHLYWTCCVYEWTLFLNTVPLRISFPLRNQEHKGYAMAEK